MQLPRIRCRRTSKTFPTGALKEGRTIAFADQSGFYLLPSVARTYAPVGQTPVLHEHLSRNHLLRRWAPSPPKASSTCSSRSEPSRESSSTLPKAPHAPYSGQAVGGLGWFADSSRRCGQRFPCQRGSFSAATRTVALLYAPNLNPDEGIWKHLKCVELKNLCCESLSELKVELRKAKERLRHKRDVILGCIRQPGFEV